MVPGGVQRKEFKGSILLLAMVARTTIAEKVEIKTLASEGWSPRRIAAHTGKSHAEFCYNIFNKNLLISYSIKSESRYTIAKNGKPLSSLSKKKLIYYSHLLDPASHPNSTCTTPHQLVGDVHISQTLEGT
jgi:hypothetical protein